MQSDMHEQEKNLLFLPLCGTIIGNAYGVGVSRALKADLIQYYLNGDFIIDRNKTTVIFALCNIRESPSSDLLLHASLKLRYDGFWILR